MIDDLIFSVSEAYLSKNGIKPELAYISMAGQQFYRIDGLGLAEYNPINQAYLYRG